MENCIVCLEFNEDIFSRITTLSSEWMEGKMQRIIEKHLWWWYLKPSQKNGIVRWICRKCWQEISSFHHFYDKVEKSHRYYQRSVSTMKPINRNEKKLTIVKLEESESLEPSNNELELVRGRLKERPQKHYKNIGKFKRKAIDFGDVKGEFGLSSNCCDTDELACANSLTEDNEIQSKESEPIVHIRKFQEKHKTEPICSKKQFQMETKRINLKENTTCKTVYFDNFFKESQHKLQCGICNEPLSDFRKLKSHYRNEHNTKGYAMCCGNKYFKRCLLYDHLKVHRDPNFFKCTLCAKAYATRRGFKTHLETHQIRERKYSCDECGKSYFKMHIFERHKLTHVPECERNFNCSQCNKKFASDYLRRQHENSTHDKKYAKICDKCGKSFNHSCSFLRHMDEHAGVPPSMETCDICGANLTTKKGLREHMKMMHLEENLKEHVCPYCSRVSPNLNAHRKHVKYTHIMQRKHGCHLCDKAFRRPLELKEHLCTHTGEALYTCTHCPRTFISHANMYKHRKIVHRSEWEESRLNKLNKKSGKTTSTDMAVKLQL